MTPKKTKSGKYHVTAYIGKVNGKPKYKSFTAPTKRECVLKVTEYINHHPSDPNNMTIKTAVDLYIESKERVLSPSTITGYLNMQRRYFEPISALTIDEFDNYQLQKFVSSLTVSPKTIRNVYGLLISSLKMFSDKQYKITLPEKVTPNRTVATEEDVKALLAAADPEMKKAIILGSCSLRRGEVSALRYSDIKGNTIFVHADIVKNKDNIYIYKDSAKTPTSTRSIKVSDNIIKALGKGRGYVVDIPNPDIITKRMTRLRDRLGINVSFHSLRRFYASISHALLIPSEYIMKQGGWKNEAVMIESYRQTLDENEKNFNKAWNDKISSIIV